mgnify:CR=1 FL=1
MKTGKVMKIEDFEVEDISVVSRRTLVDGYIKIRDRLEELEEETVWMKKVIRDTDKQDREHQKKYHPYTERLRGKDAVQEWKVRKAKDFKKLEEEIVELKETIRQQSLTYNALVHRMSCIREYSRVDRIREAS